MHGYLINALCFIIRWNKILPIHGNNKRSNSATATTTVAASHCPISNSEHQNQNKLNTRILRMQKHNRKRSNKTYAHTHTHKAGKTELLNWNLKVSPNQIDTLILTCEERYRPNVYGRREMNDLYVNCVSSEPSEAVVRYVIVERT